MKLTETFYRRDAVTVARQLLGHILVHRTPEGRCAGRIVETEAYTGPGDRAAHSHTGVPTPRTQVMYQGGGVAYIFLIYGLYCCFNVVAGREGDPQAVLVRALEPVDGITLMQARRPGFKGDKLCAGPGRLCSAMAITRALGGVSLLGDTLYIEEGLPLAHSQVAVTPRIGVDYAGAARDFPYRFVEKDSPCLSR